MKETETTLHALKKRGLRIASAGILACTLGAAILDKKEYLFEAQLNKALGRPNFKTCKKLLKMCPEIRRRQSDR